MIVGEKIPNEISRAMRSNLSNRDKTLIATQSGFSVPTVNNLLYGVTNVTKDNSRVVRVMIAFAHSNATKKLNDTKNNLKILSKLLD